jgi:broad specificity phosphatase PhoE
VTTFFLVRHCAHALVGKVLAGRMDGVHLDAAGQAQALALASHFAGSGITAVYSSPRERAVETARPIAQAAGVGLEIDGHLDELDCGAWTGSAFSALDGDPLWRRWNAARATAQIPSGENMQEVQARVLAYLRRLSAAQPDGRIVVVSHLDVLRAGLLHYLGRSLDAYDSIEIDPAAVSTLVIDRGEGSLRTLNQMVGA